MAEKSAELGKTIHKLLMEKGIETPIMGVPPIDRIEDEQAIEKAIHDILGLLNLDLEDDSLRDTPRRVAKMFCHEIFGGLNYDNFPKDTTIANSMEVDEIVCVRDITVRSTCEHHLQPIYGRAHLAYIPDKKLLGLSKFDRILDFFATRPQVQERLTEQVHATLVHVLGTEDVAVYIEAAHFCMRMRGVRDSASTTVTSKMGGRFRTQEAARREVIAIMTGGSK